MPQEVVKESRAELEAKVKASGLCGRLAWATSAGRELHVARNQALLAAGADQA